MNIGTNKNETEIESAPLNTPDFSCRICMGDSSDGKLFRPCRCKGSMQFVHVECLQKWREQSSNRQAYFRCEQCHYQYNLQRITASGLINQPFILLLMTFFFSSLAILLIALPIHFLFDTKYLIGLKPPWSDVVVAVCVIGVLGFFAMLVLEGCDRHQGGWFDTLFSNNCCLGCDGLCVGDSCIPVVVAMMVALLAFIVIVGLFRTMGFLYKTMKQAAQGTISQVDTIVLEIREETSSTSGLH